MSDIVNRLRFDATRCEATFSKGVAGNITEAADEIERLRTENSLPAETDSIGRQLREPLAPEDDMSDLRKLEMALAQRDALVEALEAILETDPQGYDVAPMSYVLRKQAKAALAGAAETRSKT